ncbi:hypothetical protein SAMN04488692_102161 [Halarsenatibacter silvermanii]|uniref:Uncharacterized protein n=1 Tax=Halarsenatibacter silvermanii TaxID=321763 RepID=A0A1G9IB77_9FIRM|nr:hypothetical protein SAMN04488692_102161 [Halarsenatibacter silvermanii]
MIRVSGTILRFGLAGYVLVYMDNKTNIKGDLTVLFK